jgi:hypothetical protein
MSDEHQGGEKPAVKTTIVGGRPPGSGKDVGQIPRGIEVLVKKASVDPSFRRLLLDKRAQAADEIGLKLSPAEVSMLTAIPAAQLEAVIAAAKVEDRHIAAFMGKVAAVMLAALAVGAFVGCPTLGIQPDPTISQGIRPGPDRNIRNVHRPAEPAAGPATGPSTGPSTQPGPTRGIQPDVPPPMSKGHRLG